MKPLGLVVAIGPGGVIGKDGGLPWHIPEDLKHFKRVTMGHAIIMGRKTHESIGRPLPGRRNIVVTRDRSARFEGCDVAHSVEEAVDLARSHGDTMPMLVGGAAIYEAGLPLVTRMFVTEVERSVEGGSVFFPDHDLSLFVEEDRTPGETEGVSFVTLARR